MRPAILIALILTLGACMHSFFMEAERLPPSDAGISDELLERMGPAADVELLRRFSDPTNLKYMRGLLERMAVYGDLDRPNAAISGAVIDYIEGEVASCKGEVEFERIMNITFAFDVIGARGGDEGLNYLKGWITNESVFQRVICRPVILDLASVHDMLQRGALSAVGFIGSKATQEFLNQVAQKPPSVKYPDTFEKVLKHSAETNEMILNQGYKAFSQETRNYYLKWSRRHVKVPS